MKIVMLLVMLLSNRSSSYSDVLVAAASDLKFAMEEIREIYTAKSSIKLVFGSSGQFFTQIQNGAPYAIYMSADEDYVLKLSQERGLNTVGDLYAIGRLVLIGSTNSLESLKRAVNEGTIIRFAIANPDHAPYGRAAKQVLQNSGIWDLIVTKLVYGENVTQAAQFALSNSTQGGIIAYSLALAPALKLRTGHYLIDESMHEPLRQRMILLRDQPEAVEFYQFLKSQQARTVFERYGFIIPSE